MTLEENLSGYTTKKNDEVAKQIFKQNEIAAAEEERLFKFKETKGKNCSEMIQEFNVACRTLNYQLKRLVADKDSHQILHPRRREKIEVIPETYMYFKVITKDMHGPGKIHFSYGEGFTVRKRRASIVR